MGLIQKNKRKFRHALPAIPKIYNNLSINFLDRLIFMIQPMILLWIILALKQPPALSAIDRSDKHNPGRFHHFKHFQHAAKFMGIRSAKL